jgi:hypothetical protein
MHTVHIAILLLAVQSARKSPLEMDQSHRMTSPAGLRAFLADAPFGETDLPGLLEAWRVTRVRARCNGAAALATNRNGANNIRGAWGRALAEGASVGAVERRECDWAAPCAYDLFFNPMGKLAARLDIPKPWVIALLLDGDDLIVELSLFGVAGDWAGEAADGLVRGLRRGLDGPNGPRPFEVSDRTIEAAEGLPMAQLPLGAQLAFRTPLEMRSGDDAHLRPASVIKSLANRASGLARWHGLRLAIGPAELSAQAELAGAAARWEEAAPTPWRRGSKAQDRTIPLAGRGGVLSLPITPPMIAALLTVGATAHAGGRVTLGLGRYDLIPGIEG